mmetsp:Transcript_80284/g.236125  ORF Transcript_80284/g.236125 Transcript_80284/m.236125 type:complete len:200 (-) Transcript_80284:1042-1641(-)
MARDSELEHHPVPGQQLRELEAPGEEPALTLGLHCARTWGAANRRRLGRLRRLRLTRWRLQREALARGVEARSRAGQEPAEETRRGELLRHLGAHPRLPPHGLRLQEQRFRRSGVKVLIHHAQRALPGGVRGAPAHHAVHQRLLLWDLRAVLRHQQLWQREALATWQARVQQGNDHGVIADRDNLPGAVERVGDVQPHG